MNRNASTSENAHFTEIEAENPVRVALQVRITMRVIRTSWGGIQSVTGKGFSVGGRSVGDSFPDAEIRPIVLRTMALWPSG